MQLCGKRGADHLVLDIDVDAGGREWDPFGSWFLHFEAYRGGRFAGVNIEKFWLCEILFLLDCILVSFDINSQLMLNLERLYYNLSNNIRVTLQPEADRYLRGRSAIQPRKQACAVHVNCVLLFAWTSCKL
jgi:hypothetical protein